MRVLLLMLVLLVSSASASTIEYVGTFGYIYAKPYPTELGYNVPAQAWKIGDGFLTATLDLETYLFVVDANFTDIQNDFHSYDWMEKPIAFHAEFQLYEPALKDEFDFNLDGKFSIFPLPPDATTSIHPVVTRGYWGEIRGDVGLTSLFVNFGVVGPLEDGFVEQNADLQFVRTPEPSSLLLLGLGALGWRRGRGPRLMA